jgi:hypothetical protein
LNVLAAEPLVARGGMKRKSSDNSFVVIGGSIAGISCAQELAKIKSAEEHDIDIVLISTTEVLKEVSFKYPEYCILLHTAVAMFAVYPLCIS